MPLFLPPLAGGERRRPALDLPGKGKCGAAYLGEAPASLDPSVDVDSARPGGLGPAGQAVVLQHLMDDHRHLADVSPPDAGTGIKIDAQLVRMLEVVSADGVRVEVNAAQVHNPGQRGRVADDHLVGGAP